MISGAPDSRTVQDSQFARTFSREKFRDPELQRTAKGVSVQALSLVLQVDKKHAQKRLKSDHQLGKFGPPSNKASQAFLEHDRSSNNC